MVGPGEVEGGGVEFAPQPDEHVVALGMVGISQGLAEVLVTRRTTHILGRAGIGAVQANWVVQAVIRRQNLFHLDAVFPVVAEAIDVAKGLLAREGAGKRDPLLRNRVVRPIRIGQAEAAVGDLEFMQVGMTCLISSDHSFLENGLRFSG